MAHMQTGSQHGISPILSILHYQDACVQYGVLRVSKVQKQNIIAPSSTREVFVKCQTMLEFGWTCTGIGMTCTYTF